MSNANKLMLHIQKKVCYFKSVHGRLPRKLKMKRALYMQLRDELIRFDLMCDGKFFGSDIKELHKPSSFMGIPIEVIAP